MLPLAEAWQLILVPADDRSFISRRIAQHGQRRTIGTRSHIDKIALFDITRLWCAIGRPCVHVLRRPRVARSDFKHGGDHRRTAFQIRRAEVAVIQHHEFRRAVREIQHLVFERQLVAADKRGIARRQSVLRAEAARFLHHAGNDDFRRIARNDFNLHIAGGRQGDFAMQCQHDFRDVAVVVANTVDTRRAI